MVVTNELKEAKRVIAPVALNTLSVNVFTAPGHNSHQPRWPVLAHFGGRASSYSGKQNSISKRRTK